MFDPHPLVGPNILPPLQAPLTSGSVWHYTSPSGLLGIVQSGVLWASSARTMNDTGELAYGLQVIRDVWADLPKPPTAQDAVTLIDRAFAIALDLEALSHVYFACASREPDLLAQWLGYANPAGYAVKLDLAKPWTTVENMALGVHHFARMIRTGWYEVIYDPETQVELARDLFLWILAADDVERYVHMDPDDLNSPERVAEAPAQIGALLQVLMATFKDPAFAVEEEVRYVGQCLNSEALKYRATSTAVIPYVEISSEESVTTRSVARFANAAELPKLRLDILEVLAGPNATGNAADIAKTMLGVNGHYVPVRRSEVPRLAI